MKFHYDLTVIKNKAALLSFLGITEEQFAAVCEFSEVKKRPSLLEIPEEPYLIPFFEHTIPKKNAARGFRTVWEADEAYKDAYKAVARRLDTFFKKAIGNYPHPNAFGYVIGRNIRENAWQHRGKRYLLKVDIKDFFPSISVKRIAALFSSLGVAEEVAEMLASFLTIQGKLPLGLSPSPIIANAVCVGLDEDLAAMAEATGNICTRYADDITVSSDDAMPDSDAVFALVAKHGFVVATDKTRRSTVGQAHYVTGLSVTDKSAPHAPRRMKKDVRQYLYYAGKFGLNQHFGNIGCVSKTDRQSEVNRIDGLVKYVSFHEPHRKNELYAAWAAILEKSGWRPSFHPKEEKTFGLCIFVDEAELKRKGRNVLAICMSASLHQDLINEATSGVYERFVSDVWADGDRKDIVKNGLHYADATEDLKLSYVEALQSLPFKGYVAFAEYTNASEYADTYVKILEAMIRRRLMAAEGRSAFFFFEENSKVPEARIRKVVENAFLELWRRNNRRPRQYGIKFVGKTWFGVSVPDFLLGVLCKYLKSKVHDDEKPHIREHIMFERLRDKYRLILDVDARIEYSRRKPILPFSAL